MTVPGGREERLDMGKQELKDTVSILLSCDVESFEHVSGGQNSRVYRASCGRNGVFAVKEYFQGAQDERDRLEAEFLALQFMWQHGLRCVPEPIAAEGRTGCAVYEYIEGNRIDPGGIGSTEIDGAADFLGRLDALRTEEGSSSLPAAAEACFSLEDIVGSIQVRLDRLRAVPADERGHPGLGRFVERRFVPAFNEISGSCRSSMEAMGMRCESELDPAERTLSPSDFGFHNCLRRRSGELVFLDFEYFGWDDPVKMISDFLLHPAMELTEAMRERFVSAMLRRFESRGALASRLAVEYPLFGLKWCMILLNEFLRADLERRTFAMGEAASGQECLERQLKKAERMLDRVMHEFGDVPYGH